MHFGFREKYDIFRILDPEKEKKKKRKKAFIFVSNRVVGVEVKEQLEQLKREQNPESFASQMMGMEERPEWEARREKILHRQPANLC